MKVVIVEAKGFWAMMLRKKYNIKKTDYNT